MNIMREATMCIRRFCHVFNSASLALCISLDAGAGPGLRPVRGAQTPYPARDRDASIANYRRL